MATAAGRVLVAAAACLLTLTGCETSVKLGDLFQSKAESPQPLPSSAEADTAPTDSVRAPPNDFQPDAVPKGLLGKDPNDDLSLGKKYFRAADFGLAERHFRKAVEMHPRDLESWIGLAASYDRLRRFDLADRAYAQATKIAGATPEILNNVGYSYMLRGDSRRAREILVQAQAQDPGNPYIRNNLELLEASFRKAKAIQ
jgi:cytochrome c-type biogenesis protein CcmH/NrfG